MGTHMLGSKIKESQDDATFSSHGLPLYLPFPALQTCKLQNMHIPTIRMTLTTHHEMGRNKTNYRELDLPELEGEEAKSYFDLIRLVGYVTLNLLNGKLD